MRKIRIEIRNDSVLLDGYVNATGKDSKPIPSLHGKFIEQIKPDAFKKSLEKRDNVDLLLNHDKNRKLGSISDGNLELIEDGIGLRAVCTVTDPVVIEKAKNKQLRGWSFGFYSEKDRWEDTTEGYQRRYVEELDIFEVSIIDDTKSPAYIGTSIEMRDNQEVLSENRSLEVEAKIIDETREVKQEVNYSKYENLINKFKEDK
ncbi:MAG: HK97 family phage prohead protease [Clostridium sp.]